MERDVSTMQGTVFCRQSQRMVRFSIDFRRTSPQNVLITGTMSHPDEPPWSIEPREAGIEALGNAQFVAWQVAQEALQAHWNES